MILAAAVCPQPPGMVPELGSGVADDLAEVRAASIAAIGGMLGVGVDRVLVVGDGAAAISDDDAGGTLAGFGVDVRAGGPDLVLPPALTVGAWLLDQAGWDGRRTYTSGLVDDTGDIGVLVMADGSSRHRRLAPEWSDVEGRQFDAKVAQALGSGDAEALGSLDLALADEVGASGITGLVSLGACAKGASVEARLRYEGAPFDVGYWVADWRFN